MQPVTTQSVRPVHGLPTGRSRSSFLIVAVIMTLLMSIVPATAASASPRGSSATPDNDSSHPWATNGCTAVPDRIWGVMDFNHACDHHDGCYGGHWQSRWGCDVTFYYDMDRSCNEDWKWWHPSRSLCKATRSTYFSGVRALGYVAYNGWSISGPSGW